MQLSEQIGMILLVFALLGGLLWFAKRRGMVALGAMPRRSGSTRRLEVLERIPLTPQHAVHLVRVADRTVLIATAPNSCTLLNAPVTAESTTSLSPSSF
jgi:flagellar biosynthetic protein FliO